MTNYGSGGNPSAYDYFVGHRGNNEQFARQCNRQIEPNTEGLEIRRRENPPPRVPPTVPQSPRSNIATDISGLLTEDEGDLDQVVPPTIYPPPLETQGRTETLSPTPNRNNMVRSAIELTVNDLQLSEQRICDKCSKVDFN